MADVRLAIHPYTLSFIQGKKGATVRFQSRDVLLQLPAAAIPSLDHASALKGFADALGLLARELANLPGQHPKDPKS